MQLGGDFAGSVTYFCNAQNIARTRGMTVVPKSGERVPLVTLYQPPTSGLFSPLLAPSKNLYRMCSLFAIPKQRPRPSQCLLIKVVVVAVVDRVGALLGVGKTEQDLCPRHVARHVAGRVGVRHRLRE